jgi:hypothetical protein
MKECLLLTKRLFVSYNDFLIPAHGLVVIIHLRSTRIAFTKSKVSSPPQTPRHRTPIQGGTSYNTCFLLSSTLFTVIVTISDYVLTPCVPLSILILLPQPCLWTTNNVLAINSLFKDAILPEDYIQVSSSHVCYRSSLSDLITGEILCKQQELL